MQTDPSLHWVHRSFCWFCCAQAQIKFDTMLTLSNFLLPNCWNNLLVLDTTLLVSCDTPWLKKEICYHIYVCLCVEKKSMHLEFYYCPSLIGFGPKLLNLHLTSPSPLTNYMYKTHKKKKRFSNQLTHVNFKGPIEDWLFLNKLAP